MAATIAVTIEELQRLFGPAIVADMQPIMFGFHRLGLVGTFEYGEVLVLPSGGSRSYAKFEPTVLGCALFLIASGHDPRDASRVLNDHLQFKQIVDVGRGIVFAASEVKAFNPNQIAPPEPIPPG